MARNGDTYDIIFKYPLTIGTSLEIGFPVGAMPVLVGMQKDQPTLWMRFQKDAPPVELRRFIVVGTGHLFGATAKHIGSMQDGPFVWHVLELE